MVLGMAKRLVSHLYQNHLLLTNTVTCGGLLALGDGIQQGIELRKAPKFNYDWERTGRMFAIGFALGPMSHWWYSVLDRLYPKPIFRNVARKILLDQVFGAPTFSLVFIGGMAKMEGKDNRAALQEFAHKFPFIYMVDWLVWPPAQALNFYLVPPHFRVLFVYLIDLCWYTFNSYVKHESAQLPFPAAVRQVLSEYENPRPHKDEDDKKK